jgi:hypothetical protein
MSAFPPKATEEQTLIDVGFVPEGDIRPNVATQPMNLPYALRTERIPSFGGALSMLLAVALAAVPQV